MGGNTRFYVLAGVSMSYKDWEYISKQFDQIMTKYFPKGAPELHTKHLVNGSPPFNTINHKKLVDQLADFMKTAHVTLFGIAINKPEYVQKIGPAAQIVDRSLEEMINRFHIYLQRHSAMGILVSDASAVGFDTRVRNLYEYFRRKGTRFVRLKRIIDTIFFTPSETAIGIQLADFVAYAVKRHCENNDDSIYSIIERKFDTFSGKVHGFRVIPK
jgi:hypothetical protein